MGKVSSLVLCIFFATSAFAQSVVSIDKLDKTSLAQAKKEVGFSTLIEGAVADPELTVFVMVRQPQLKTWRLFPAVVSEERGSDGKYRWRAICQFGELDGKGVGDLHEIKAISFDKSKIANGLPTKLSAEVANSGSISVTRTK